MASHGTHILSPEKSVQKSLIALSQSVHTKAVQNFHQPCVKIALFEFRVGCHSGVRGDNRVYPELVNALIEQMKPLN